MKKGDVTITREYIVSVKELRKIYGLEGELIEIGLWQGRSIDDEEKGKSPDTDLYVITTKEKTTSRKANDGKA